MKKRFFLLIAISLLLTQPRAIAQETNERDNSMSIEHIEFNIPKGLMEGFLILNQAVSMQEAVEIGLQHNQQIKLAGTDRDIQKAMLKGAQAKRWPVVSLGSNTFLHNSNNQTFMTTDMMMTTGSSTLFQDLNVSAKMPIFTGGKIIAGIRAAQSSLEGSQAVLTQTSIDTAYQIREAYLKILLTQAEHLIHQEHINVQYEMLKNAQARYKAGRGLKSDVLRIQTEIANAQKMLNDEHTKLNNAMFDLKAAMGIDLSSNITVPDTLNFSPWTGTDLPALIQMAVSHHPKIQKTQAAIRETEAKLKVVRATYLPQISGQVSGSLRFREEAPMMGNGVVGWISASLPAFDRNRSADIEEVQAQLNKAKQERKATELEIGKAIAQAWTELQFTKDNVALSEAAIIQSQEDFRLISKRAQTQRAIMVEVQDAALKLHEANLNRITAIYSYELAKAKLLATSGNI